MRHPGMGLSGAGGIVSTTTPPAIWRGHLYADGTGGVYGHLVDSWGYRVEIRGVRDANGPGYVLTGTLAVPAVERRAGDAAERSGQGPPPEGSFW